MATFQDWLLAAVPGTDRADLIAAADASRTTCTCDPCCPACCTCTPTSPTSDPEGDQL